MRLLGFPRLSPVILVYNTPGGEGRGERGEERGEWGESEDLRDHVVFRGNGVGIGLVLLFWLQHALQLRTSYSLSPGERGDSEDFEGSHGFQGKWRGDQPSPTEDKGRLEEIDL